MTTQDKLKAALERAGLPSKEIKVYGSQIVVTCWSEDAARKWAELIGKFAKVRGVLKSQDETKDPSAYFKAHPGPFPGSSTLTKRTFTHDVWRVFAAV